MNHSIETYDPHFRPLLRRFAVGDLNSYCNAYKIPDKAYPAPTLNGNKAAYWIGTPQNPEQSIPIIAVSVPLQRITLDFSKVWSIGVASANDINDKVDLLKSSNTSVNPVGAAVLEFASSGLYTHIDALALVVKLCPLPRS
ncbi:hypothetical protein EB118_01845 [bacterium]|nr:hypothetical protein [bacterium]NBX97926.1 hypothetical protein [bacterium]NDC94318.1 hypothetical protein [bacterium]NDD82782.1 hypothetical protein [bacterium]NDG28830.1 hypothetical protein [bacterium]